MANAKRQKVEEMILKTVKLMEPEGSNHERYKKLFSSMNDKQFDTFMNEIKTGKRKLTFLAPNMKVVLKQKNLMDAAEYVNAEIFTHITYTDPVTGLKYTTPDKACVLTLPVRRTRQFLQHGLSVPEGDSHVDTMTGQVMKPDQASKFSFPEMQLLFGRGLNKTIEEFMKIRGGDINAYAQYRQSIEETGSFNQSSLSDDTVPRTAMVSSLILTCMGLDNNLVEMPQDHAEIPMDQI